MYFVIKLFCITVLVIFEKSKSTGFETSDVDNVCFESIEINRKNYIEKSLKKHNIICLGSLLKYKKNLSKKVEIIHKIRKTLKIQIFEEIQTL